MQWLTVKNWDTFQHYKDRNPPWIKLHRTLLDDYEFASLPDRSKAHLILLWLFASQQDGRIPNDPSFLTRKLGLEVKPDLEVLVEHGFLLPEQGATDTVASGLQSAPLVRGETQKPQRQRRSARPLPPDYQITDEMRGWVTKNGYDQPEAALDYMRDWAASGGHQRADWDATLRNCIKGDWGDARKKARERILSNPNAPRQITPCTTPMCKGEGVQLYKGKCQVCYAQSKPARAA